MRVGIYTDVHCAYTSSILPTFLDGSKYTLRLQMIIDTFKWMYEVFEKNNVDLIVNCGDLFDSHSVRAEELSAMSEALSYGAKIPELHILGNHEILDKHRQFNAVALLNNYSHIDIVSDPLKLDCGISLLPYCSTDDAAEVIPYLSNDILFSHIDIKGSYVTPEYALDVGVEPARLSNNFKRVINGHLHSPQSFDRCVHNIGSTTSLSFSDNSNYTPRVSIIDTKSLSIEYFENPHAIRFIKVPKATPETISKMLESVSNRMALRVDCSIEDKAAILSILDSCERVVAHRVRAEHIVITSQSVNNVVTQSALESVTDVDAKFLEFLEACNELKYPLTEYQNVIASLVGGVDSEN